jgi:hypothetical protein
MAAFALGGLLMVLELVPLPAATAHAVARKRL